MKQFSSEKRIHRDMAGSVVSGVCAGVARYLEIDAMWVRGAAILALLMMPVVTVVAYIAAVCILPRW